MPTPVKQFILVLGGLFAVLSTLAPIITACVVAGGVASSVIFGVIAAIAAIVVAIMNWQTIWEGMQAVWQSVCAVISSTFEALCSFFGQLFQGVSDMFGTIWQTICQIFTTFTQQIVDSVMTGFNGLSAFWSSVLDTILSVAVSVWESISNTISVIWNGMVSTASSLFEGLSSTLSGIWNGIESTITTVFNSISSTAASVWNGITDTISNAINTAKDIVGGCIDAIRGFFNFKFEWPHIPLPHFSIKGSINPLDWFSQGLPSIDVQWFAKGGILTKPTVFGQNGNSLMVGGETSDNEAVIPLNKHTLGLIGKGIAETMGHDNKIEIHLHIEQLSVRQEDDLYTLADKIAVILTRKLQQQYELSGGVV